MSLTFSYQSMKRLIDLAFLYVDEIGPHVYEGHFDLVTTQGTIILPDLYETEIKPGHGLTMHMWPIPAPPKPAPRPVIVEVAPPKLPPPPPPPPARGNRPSRRYSSDCDSRYSSSFWELESDSDIVDGPEDLGIEIDYEKEIEKAELPLGELLGKWTYATDLLGDSVLGIDTIDDDCSYCS